MSNHRTDIPPFAASRAEAMLPALQRDLARSVRRRRIAHRVIEGGAAATLLLSAIVAAMLTVRPHPHAPTPTADPAQVAESPKPTIQIVRTLDAPSIEIVRDAPTVSVITVSTEARVDLAAISVTDRELLDLLNEIGRPSGLVRANGRVWLTAAVTDEEIAKRRGG